MMNLHRTLRTKCILDQAVQVPVDESHDNAPVDESHHNAPVVLTLVTLVTLATATSKFTYLPVPPMT